MTRLKQLGTIAFDSSTMKKLINYGRVFVDPKTKEVQIVRELDPSALELGLWLQFVPDVFRAKATEVMMEITRDILFCEATEKTKEKLIISFQQKVDNAISKKELTIGRWI